MERSDHPEPTPDPPEQTGNASLYIRATSPFVTNRRRHLPPPTSPKSKSGPDSRLCHRRSRLRCHLGTRDQRHSKQAHGKCWLGEHLPSQVDGRSEFLAPLPERRDPVPSWKAEYAWGGSYQSLKQRSIAWNPRSWMIGGKSPHFLLYCTLLRKNGMGIAIIALNPVHGNGYTQGSWLTQLSWPPPLPESISASLTRTRLS
jgi:hypothetical protein